MSDLLRCGVLSFSTGLMTFPLQGEPVDSTDLLALLPTVKLKPRNLMSRGDTAGLSVLLGGPELPYRDKKGTADKEADGQNVKHTCFPNFL